ncbi:uncharacterized protein LOC124134567 [Haliotis rufescens]|uniref:uncharacterized protein LOC124134567 n=1 Tax=Haliotis rufescens TaxID=6454 RepID=UPI00201F43D7|nr:uncharacterized protein LOC124134567 [Haliotis rufescens]
MPVYAWSDIVVAAAFCAVVALTTLICIRCQATARRKAHTEANRSDVENLSIRSSAQLGGKQQHQTEEAGYINELSASVDQADLHGDKDTSDEQADEKDDAFKPLKTQTEAVLSVPQWRESEISLGEDPLPPVCGAIDQFRQSYGYICTNPLVRPIPAAVGAGSRQCPTGNDSLKSDVFFDAASSQSGELGTLAKWIRDIQKMSDVTPVDYPGERGSREIAKSYDASSEDSYTTAVESSEEIGEDSGMKVVNEKPPRKRRVSRKSRSLYLANSLNKNQRDKTRRNATWSPGKHNREGHPSSSSSVGYKSGSSQDLGAEALCEAETEPLTDDDPIYTNVSGMSYQARRHEHFAKDRKQPGTESLQKGKDTSRPFVCSLVLRDGMFLRSESSSSIGMSLPPRAGSYQDILMREPDAEIDGVKRRPPKKPARHLSHSVSHFGTPALSPCSVPIHPRSCHVPPPKPCSNEVQYVNFRGSLRR